MASQGPNSPGTAAEDTSFGTMSWSNYGNVLAADSVYCSYSAGNFHSSEASIRLVKGGTIQGDDKTTGATLPGTNSYTTFGGVSDTWGLSLTDADVNANNFGGVVSVYVDGGDATYYIKATNFGFSLPAATVDGVVMDVKWWYETDGLEAATVYVDHIRITVYYTEAGGGGSVATRVVGGDIMSLALAAWDGLI